MPNQKQPIELIRAKGRKHLTKSEIEERKGAEIRAPSDCVQPPKYLNTKQKRKFEELVAQLKEIDIVANIDSDYLARYLQSEEKYLKYDKLVDRLLAGIKGGTKEDVIDTMAGLCGLLEKYENLRDKALKQCRTAATDLGLTISSRCKLVIPKPPEEKPKSKYDKFRTG